MSDKPCGQCSYYDPQYLNVKGVQRETGYGWCAKKSIYSKQQEPHQGYTIPEGATMTDDPLSSPIIVYKDKVVLACLEFLSK